MHNLFQVSCAGGLLNKCIKCTFRKAQLLRHGGDFYMTCDFTNKSFFVLLWILPRYIDFARTSLLRYRIFTKKRV